MKPSKQMLACFKPPLHLHGPRAGRVLPGLPSAQRVSKGCLQSETPRATVTNTTGETFPQRKLNVRVYTRAGGADQAVVEVLREHRYILVLAISPQRAGSWIQGPPTVVPLSEECRSNDKDL